MRNIDRTKTNIWMLNGNVIEREKGEIRLNLCKFEPRAEKDSTYTIARWQRRRKYTIQHKYFTHIDWHTVSVRASLIRQLAENEILHPNTHTHTFSQAIFCFFSFLLSFVWTPNNCSFIRRWWKRTYETTRVSQQQKNENRFGSEQQRRSRTWKKFPLSSFCSYVL